MNRLLRQASRALGAFGVAVGTLLTVGSAQEVGGKAPAAQDPGARQRALDEALRELDATPPSNQPASGQLPMPAPAPTTAGQLRLTDVSLDLLLGAGTSTEPNSVLGLLQGGGHDPKHRGFTLGQAELSIGGAVDPYFTLQSNLVFAIDPDNGETIVELEEAYAQSQALPGGLQVRAGMFLTEFGRINPTHPHAWAWQDQPVVVTRLLGGDGMRAPGVRLAWLLPTANYSELLLTVQNANGEQMPSFLANEGVYDERAIGGRAFTQRDVRSLGDLVYTARAVTSWDLGEADSTAIGASVAYGPNATGDGADTLLYGLDAVYKWRAPSNQRGWPFLSIEGEYLARAFHAAAQTDAADPLAPVSVPGTTLHDQGAYLQVLWGFTPQWDVGLRGDWVAGSGDSYDPATQTFGRDGDPYRGNRYRISPLLAYHPSEFSRLRLQYSYDDSASLDQPAHSVWLGFEMLIGKHPPHRF